jgi:hypothetical protein
MAFFVLFLIPCFPLVFLTNGKNLFEAAPVNLTDLKKQISANTLLSLKLNLEVVSKALNSRLSGLLFIKFHL